MQIFTDNAGRKWPVVINHPVIERVKARLGTDLYRVLDDTELLNVLGHDLCLFVNVLWLVVEPEAQKAGITQEQFAAAIYGDVFDAAQEAFFAELIGFFPQTKRQVLTAARAKAVSLLNQAAAAVVAKLESGELERQMVDLVSRPAPCSGGVAASSAPARAF